MRRFLAVVSVLLILGASQVQAQFAAGETWVNARGSVLSITAVDANGSFVGTYVNNAPGFGCQGTPYSVSGRQNDNAVGWVVSWDSPAEDCNSVTSWGGVFMASGILSTRWVLGYTNPTTGQQLLVGVDSFRRQ